MGEEKRKEQRRDDIVVASAHDFPNLKAPAQGSELKAHIKGKQTRMKEYLDGQVRASATLKNLTKQREQAMEAMQLQANRQEMALLREAERAKRQYDKEALAAAWNADIRLKNIWKAIEAHEKGSASRTPSAVLLDGSLSPSRG